MTKQGKAGQGVWLYFILVPAIVLLSHGLMAVLQIPGASVISGAPAPSPSALLLFLLGGFSPSIVGIIMTAWVGGRSGLRDLWKRAIHWKFDWKWYLVIGLLPALLLVARIVVQLARGGTLGESRLLIQPLSLFGFTIQLLLFGALAEEFGWRGFALDRLLTHWNFGGASLILGVLWVFWHLPLFFIPGTIQQIHGNPLIEFPVFAVSILGLTVLINWVYLGTGRSLLAAILFHMSYDWFISFGGTFLDGGIVDRVVNAGMVVILAAIVWMWAKPNPARTQASREVSTPRLTGTSQ